MFSPRKKIEEARLGCWNVRSINNKSKPAESTIKLKAILAECGTALDKDGSRVGQDLDVAGLVETNNDQEGDEDLGDWKLYHTGSIDGRQGASLAVRKRIAHLVVTWRPVGGRIVYVDLKVAKGRPWRVIAAYAPTATREHAREAEKFYSDLRSCVAGVSRWTILGDMNARLPVGPSDITGRHGRECNQRPNLNTAAFAGFLRENAAHSSASHFRHGHHAYATWRNPGTGTRFGTTGWQQIDHICYANTMQGCVRDTKVAQDAWETFPGQDHQLLVSKVRVDAFGWFGKKRKKGTANKCRQLPRPAVAEPEKVRSYNAKVGQLLGAGKSLQEAVTRAAGEARFVDEVCAEAEEYFEKHGHAPAIRAVAKLGGKKAKKPKRNIQPPLTHGEETAYTAEGRAELHRRFFAEVFGGEEPDDYPDLPEREPGRATAAGANASEEVTDAEIAAAIKRLKTGKAAGEDGMVKEHVELLDPENKKIVFEAVRKQWRTGRLTVAEVRPLITVLPKPGKDHSKTDGWRPISLLNFLAKVYAQLLYGRIAKPIDTVLEETQNGFRPYRRATDNTTALKVLTQQRYRAGKKTYACYIDLRQCFDRVPRGLIARALQYYEVPQALRDRFWALYRGHSFCVKREGKRSTETNTKTGTKQGCLLSPIIYNLVANFVFEHLPKTRADNDTAAGVAFTETGLLTGEATREQFLRDLEFADDTVLLEETLQGLTQLSERVCSLLHQFGLEVNYTKTKFMAFGGQDENTSAIKTTHGEIKRQKEFEYLGTILAEDCRDETDIDNRIILAQKKCGELTG
eukprot:g18817.t1